MSGKQMRLLVTVMSCKKFHRNSADASGVDGSKTYSQEGNHLFSKYGKLFRKTTP